MGNCMETCLPRSQQADQVAELHGEMETTTTYPQKQKPEAAAEELEEVQDEVLLIKKGIMSEISKIGDGGGGSTVRVKIVLTKEELQWLMMQLKSDGEKRLETMLEEIDMGRKKLVCDIINVGGKKCIEWKPSLESIMETPES